MKKVIVFALIFVLLCGTTYAETLETYVEEQQIEISAPVEAENRWFPNDFSFLEFEDSKIVLGVGEVYAPIVYTDAPDWMLDFYSKNSKVAEVDADGTIYAKKRGSTKIVVEAGGLAEAVVKVEVKKAPSSIKLPSVINVPVGDLESISVKLSSHSASHIEWYSSNERIVDVADGLVYGKRAGTTYVTAETYNGKRATCTVNVYKRARRIYIDPYISLKKGRSMTITPRFKNGEWDTYKIYSDNTRIVKVSGSKIRARKRGFATITVRTSNGVEAEAEVYVY